MAFKISGDKAVYTADGIPYVWNSGDTTTAPSNETKQTAFDKAPNDEFGWSVAVGSGRIVVGARLDVGASGSAYIYDLDGNLITKITASDGAPGDYFGYSVAVGSGRIVVGAPFNDDNGDDSGAAYVYDLDGNFIKKLEAGDGSAFDEFGTSVAVGSGRIVVGARFNEGRGAAYIYDIDTNNEIAKVNGGGNPGSGGRFGCSVAVGSGRIVVGAEEDNDAAFLAGSIYLYSIDGNLINKITPPNAEAFQAFGRSVAVGSGRIVVGAPGGSTGGLYAFDLNGTFLTKIVPSERIGNSVAVGSGRIVAGNSFSTDNGADSGSAYIFDLDGNEISKTIASDGAADDYFGFSVAVGSGKIVVGARTDDDPFNNTGSAYIYDTPQVYTIYDAIDLQKGYM